MRADSGRLPQSARAQVRRHLGVLCDQSALDALDATWRVSLRAAILALLRNRAQHALNGLSGRLEIPPVQPHQQVESVALRSEEHTSELQSRENLVCRLLLEKK